MRPELLSPAGNFEKMKAAILYGADAVYLAGQMFGMRAAADNFTIEELREATAYAHERGVKVYLTVNTMPREHQYESLKAYFESLKGIGIDALIIADIGVLTLAREMLPEIELHISTQANTVSSAAARAWAALGAKRVVLSRELTLDEIREIRRNIPEEIEIECFIHGSMCISYSGRCLLSNHIVGRDANMGACAQPCRWNYTIRGYEIEEEKRPDIKMPIEEVNGETFIMASRDTSTIEHIPELIEAGINSFKIEGRMKSAYYTAIVTNTYKMAINDYYAGKREPDPAYVRELDSVTHREYNTGYYFDNSKENANVTSAPGYMREKAYLGVCLGYDAERGEALIEQRNRMVVGDRVEFLTPGHIAMPLSYEALYDEEHNEIDASRHPYMRFYIKTATELSAGDIIRAVIE